MANSDLVCEAIRKLVSQSGNWSGSVSDLHLEAAKMLDETVRRSSAWPKNPSQFSKRIRRLVPTLAGDGINVEFSASHGAQREVKLVIDRKKFRPFRSTKKTDGEDGSDRSFRKPTVGRAGGSKWN